jgi:hypothetical protein
MPIQNRKSFRMAPAGKSGPSKSSPRPTVRRPSISVSRPKESFSRPVSPRKEVGPRQETPNLQGIREGYPGQNYPNRRTPFYRRSGSIIGVIVLIVVCLICLAIVGVVWILPYLTNGSLHL